VVVGLMLNYHHEDEMDRLLDAQTDESSPTYHHFLSQKQFQNYFAPSVGEYNRAIASLQRGGFTITHTFANRTLVDASAPAAVAERYFSTEIHNVAQPGVGVRHLAVRPATIPRDISDIALGVVGLSNVRTLKAQYQFLPKNAPRPLASKVRSNSEPVFGPDGGYGPVVFTNSYDLPSLSGFTGTGRASGVATDGDFLDSDLAGYLSYFGVTRTGPATTRVLVDGGPPPGNEAPDSVETALDVETIVSLAPGTALYVYEAKESDDLVYFTDIYNQAVVDNAVDTMNSSYAECETAFEPTFPKMADKIFKQGATEGITFHSATGDYGIYTYGCSGSISVNTPADSPHNIAVGGTRMAVDANGNETSEVGWNDQGCCATGGGVSIVFKTPSYQKNVPNVITPGRNIPDLAYDASPYTGASYYYQGQFQGPIGGTSLASPTFGAALTEIDQIKGSRAGYLNAHLYKSWEKAGYGTAPNAYFRDITSGSLPPYEAQVGYDQMTGIGAMIATNFEKVLKGKGK
jgi:kumamolisin